MDTPTVLSPDAVAAELLGAQPATPQPTAPVQPATEPAPRGQPLSAFRKGFHRENPDGSPFRNRYGNFMPRGGRKSSPSAVAVSDTAPQPTAPIQPVTEPTAGTVPAPVSEAASQVSAPEKPAWSAAERAAAASTAVPVDSVPANAQQAEIDTSADAAEVAAEALFFCVGAIFNAHDEATPAKPEAEKLVRVLAAWIRSTGWRGTAGICALLAVVAYLLRFLRKPKASAKVQDWIGQLKTSARIEKAVPVQPQPAAEQTKQPEPPQATGFNGFTERSAL